MDEKQEHAYNCIRDGKSILLTGPGGTGKSFFIAELQRRMKIDKPTKRIGVTALTGCAAVLLGGKAKTIHSWAGMGLGRGTVQEIVANIRKSKKAIKRWLLTDILIIDEVSMMSGDMLDKLDAVGKAVRQNREKAFGGIQVVLVGDFYQLPPITNDDEALQFAFDAKCWPQVVQEVVQLEKVYRQSDERFQGLLGRIRRGQLGPDDKELLLSRKGLDWKADPIWPTLLFSRRATVDKINAANLAELEGDTFTWKAKTVYSAGADGKGVPVKDRYPEEMLARMIAAQDKDAPYDVDLVLKVGAQVMLIANIDTDAGLVNGSRGVVVNMEREAGELLPVVQFKNGVKMPIGRWSWTNVDEEDIARSQIPLRLAYAVTIHKCQGATLDCGLVDIGKSTFECGQAYVALSRVKSLDSLYVWDFVESAIMVHPRVKRFYENLSAVSLEG